MLLGPILCEIENADRKRNSAFFDQKKKLSYLKKIYIFFSDRNIQIEKRRFSFSISHKIGSGLTVHIIVESKTSERISTFWASPSQGEMLLRSAVVVAVSSSLLVLNTAGLKRKNMRMLKYVLLLTHIARVTSTG